MTSVSVSRSTYGLALAAAALVAVVAWWLVVALADMRLVAAIAGSLVLLQICLLRPRTTVMAMLVWLPFAGLVRRLFDFLAPANLDPLLAIVPTVTVTIVLVAAWNHRNSLAYSLRYSAVTRLVALLVLVLLLSMFNPIQGGILVGLGGAVFLFFPVLWFFLGRTYFDDEFVRWTYGVIVAVGVVCGLYGGYQAAFGVLPFEHRWIVTKEFASMWVGGFIRPFSTFPNSEEWSRYMTVAATVAFGFLVTGARRKLWWAALGLLCTSTLFVAGVRTSVFGFLVSLGVLCVLAPTSHIGRLVRILGLAGALAGYLWFVPTPTGAEKYESDVAWRVFFGHTVRGLNAPLNEDTLWLRTDIWTRLFTDVIPEYPLGMGLGVPTLGAWRFDATTSVGTESYSVAVFVAAGLIGGGLLLAILAMVAWQAWQLCGIRRDRLSLITCAILANLIFTSLVGNSLSLYTIGAIGWGLMGWVSAQWMRREAWRGAAEAGPVR